MTIYVDADACPVVDETLHIAHKYSIPCVLVCDTAHELSRPGARTIIVSQGADSVDFALVNLISPGDIVVTQDYALAAMCLARRAIPLHQDGMIYDENNIDALLLQRHVSRKIRMAGGRTRGPKKRLPEQDRAFEASLRALIERAK